MNCHGQEGIILKKADGACAGAGLRESAAIHRLTTYAALAVSFAVFAAQAVGLTLAAADTAGSFVWTGAEDSYWTNAANWTVDGAVAYRCPGVLTEEVVVTETGIEPKAKFTDRAVFGTVSLAAVTVDMSGLYAISNVTVSGNTAYTFGADETQPFPLGVSGVFTVEADTAVVPVFPGPFIVCAGGWKSDVTPKIYNLTSKVLRFNEFGGIERPAGSSSWQKIFVRLYGAGVGEDGGFQFDGTTGDKKTWSVNIELYDMKKLVVNTDLGKFFYRVRVFSEGLDIEVTENGILGFGTDNGAGFDVYASFRVFGAGKMVFPYKNKAPNYNAKGYIQFGTANKTCDIRVPVEMRVDGTASDDDRTELIVRSGDKAGVFAFSGENRLGCPIVNNGPVMLSVPDVGWFNDNGLVFAGNGGVEYTGGAATFDDAVSVTNGTSFTLRNSGDGALVFASDVDIGRSGVSLVLDGREEEIRYACTFSGEKPSDIVVKGDSGVVLPAGLDFAALPKIKMDSGKLSVAKTGSIGTIEIVSGENVLFVEEGISLELANVVRTGGSLDIQPKGSASVIIKDLAGTTNPAGITYFGMPVEFDENGAAKGFVPDAVNIPARGAEIPSSALVAISSVGTTGDNTLAEDTVSINELQHMVPLASTAALGSEQHLKIDRLFLSELAGALYIGDVAGRGTLGACSGDKVFCTNMSSSAELLINARLAEGTGLSVGSGTVAFAGGAPRENPLTFEIAKTATLKLTGENTICLAGYKGGCKNLLVDDAKEVLVGESPLIIGAYLGTSFTAKPNVPCLVIKDSAVGTDRESDEDVAHNTDYAIVAGYDWGVGTVRIKDGAAVTNRLLVASLPDSASNVRLDGAVYQTGGSMCALGNANDRFGSYIGGTANKGGVGVYELGGGTFTSLGQFSVGESGRYSGIFLQTGGQSSFLTNTFYGSAKYALTIAAANSSVGSMVFDGGKAKVEGDLRMSCGSGGASSMAYLTVAGDAKVDVGECGVTGTPVNPNTWSSEATQWNKQGYVNLNGGEIRAASIGKAIVEFDRYVAVSFDGGTFKTGNSNRELFQNVDAVNVFAGGAVVDTDGKTGNKTSTPFSAPVAGGVKSVPLPPRVYSPIRPQVTIEGDGMGASAVAEFDEERGAVTGVRILCPGWGYTYAKAKIFMSTCGLVESGNADATLDCEIGTFGSGDFTKRGEGDFTFNAANTYGGKTIVEGGVLRLGVTGALPEGSDLVFDGGMIEVAEGVTLPSSIDVSVPCADDRSRRHTLMRFLGEFPETLPEFFLEGFDDPNWGVYRFGSEIRLRYHKGTVLIVR